MIKIINLTLSRNELGEERKGTEMSEFDKEKHAWNHRDRDPWLNIELDWICSFASNGLDGFIIIQSHNSHQSRTNEEGVTSNPNLTENPLFRNKWN